MKRRKFLKLGSQFSLGTLFIPSVVAASCRKQELFEDVNYKGKVTIVGAGAAGLYAGYILKSKGIDFEILEASDTTGGRLGKLEGFADFPLDTGAQWLHGRNSVLGDLIRKTKTKIKKDNSDEVFWFKQQLVSGLPNNVRKIFEEQDGLPDISFKDHSIQKGFGDEYTYIVEALAADQGADSSMLSVAANIKEEENWSSGEDDYKFRASFYDLFDEHIIPIVKDHVRLNTVVSSIDYSTDQILLRDDSNTTYVADKVILTVPITILQDSDIQFIPEFSQDRINAINKIGMGAGMKVFLKFNTKFYHENILGGKVCAAYADETEGKVGEDNVLLAFVMGKQAEGLTALGSDQAIVNELLKELDLMYKGQASTNFDKAHVQNWTTQPYIKGAYSYSTIGIGNSRTVAAKSINDRLFFAGEAFNLNGHHQTVHGAVETGYNAVIDILNSVK